MKTELLSPAGSFEGLKAVINAGADAVYLGGKKFGARAYAENFDENSLIEAIRYAHIFGVAVHMTVNTVLKEDEAEELISFLKPYYEAGLDAVIVQDLGAVEVIRKNFPELQIHLSTQLSVCGPETVNALKEKGISRVVVSRELSLEEISSIRESTGAEIETFIHGALCYCYSGRCLFSSFLGGRSGNRGRCAQPCRLEYDAYYNDIRINGKKEKYLLSPKDICTLDILPELIKSGIASFKIEGRMKKPEYAAGVTSIYRKYIDLFYRDPDNYRVDENDKKILYDLFNRDGFSEGYYFQHNGKNMMAVRNEKKGSINIDSQAVFEEVRKKYSDKDRKVSVRGTASFSRDSFSSIILEARGVAVGVLGDIPQEALSQPMSSERIKNQLQKTGGTPFAFSELEVICDDGLFIPVKQLNDLRRSAFESLENKINSYYEHRFESSTEDSYPAEDFSDEDMKEPFKNCSLNNFSVRVSTHEQLKAALEFEEIKAVIADSCMYENRSFTKFSQEFCSITRTAGKISVIALPEVFRKIGIKEEILRSDCDAFLASDAEGYFFLCNNGLKEKTIADSSLYTMNSFSRKFFDGCAGITAPFEMNKSELMLRKNDRSSLVIYGYVPLMISAQCVKKTCGKCDGRRGYAKLRDRKGKFFDVKCCCDYCYNVIYNSEPLSLYSEAEEVLRSGFRFLRLSFTKESGAETSKIIDRFIGHYFEGKGPETFPDHYTKGHFRRGVE